MSYLYVLLLFFLCVFVSFFSPTVFTIRLSCAVTCGSHAMGHCEAPTKFLDVALFLFVRCPRRNSDCWENSQLREKQPLLACKGGQPFTKDVSVMRVSWRLAVLLVLGVYRQISTVDGIKIKLNSALNR